MKVKAIKDYQSLKLKRLVKTGEELEVTEERGKKLLAAGVAEEIAEPTTPEVVTKPKKAAKKK